MTYHFDPATPERLYLHGAHNSRTLRHLTTGAPVCVTVTLLEGLVYSRTALYHSMNYRSVACFGRARRVTQEAEKRAIFDLMTQRYFPGRTLGRDYEVPPAAHIRGTSVVEVLLEEWSAKARRGGPKGPRDGDPNAPGTCGVVDLGAPHGAVPGANGHE